MDNMYLQVLINTIVKKNDLLDKLIQFTISQEENLLANPPDLDRFAQAVDEKEILIQKLSQLDDGFDMVYIHVKDEIDIIKKLYKDDILQLQLLIKQVTEKSIKLQALELQNKYKFESAIANKRNEIRNFKVSNQTASSYYKNMANQHQGQSYFLDKKN